MDNRAIDTLLHDAIHTGKRITKAQASAICRALGFTVRLVDREIQVKHYTVRSWDDPTIYYTNDYADAILTCRAMRHHFTDDRWLRIGI